MAAQEQALLELTGLLGFIHQWSGPLDNSLVQEMMGHSTIIFNSGRSRGLAHRKTRSAGLSGDGNGHSKFSVSLCTFETRLANKRSSNDSQASSTMPEVR
ncbi:hypothetical protein AVEN_9396-1 [Araneus ventricosus]|uniref:Uncharacterized protein n=1 Tax=Araneus ventricosus TaxID=182803 RepID=A0A4Y2DJ73_ARAVE|nr:hypothetical protein AVEN_9396-1 [Araneus ventricosus]